VCYAEEDNYKDINKSAQGDVTYVKWNNLCNEKYMISQIFPTYRPTLRSLPHTSKKTNSYLHIMFPMKFVNLVLKRT